MEEYDGEICMLRFRASFDGEVVDFDEPHEQEWLQRELTRTHELYYRRAYTCNCFLCLATLFPKYTGCAKFVSWCAGRRTPPWAMAPPFTQAWLARHRPHIQTRSLWALASR